MGDFEVFLIVISTFILAVIVFHVITILTIKDTLRRFGLLKQSRRDFYECGFKPQTEKPVKISIKFLTLCVFFLIYDIELAFMFPFTSGCTFSGTNDMLLICFFFIVFFVSLNVDYERHALIWQE